MDRQRDGNLQTSGARGATPTKTLWDRGTYNFMPKSNARRPLHGWLTNDKDDFDRTDLLIAPSGGLETTSAFPTRSSHGTSRPTAGRFIISRHTGPMKMARISTIFFVMDLDSKKETRLTRNARAYDLAISPDNTCIAWTRYDRGVSLLVKNRLPRRKH